MGFSINVGAWNYCWLIARIPNSVKFHKLWLIMRFIGLSLQFNKGKMPPKLSENKWTAKQSSVIRRIHIDFLNLERLVVLVNWLCDFHLCIAFSQFIASALLSLVASYYYIIYGCIDIHSSWCSKWYFFHVKGKIVFQDEADSL